MNREYSVDEILLSMQSWCALREVCISEAETKLKKYEVSEQDKQKIINQLLDAGYIDEKRYLRAFVGDKLRLNKWGPHKIRQALIMKKIPDSLIAEAIDEKTGETNQDDLLYALLHKKFVALQKSNSREIYAKLMRFALSRGFDYSLAAKIVALVMNDFNDE
ncbi:MAG: RecX family transcriptional regulator [Prevotellaceae bacterium]|nr:RecX family transcriptional regulator [Prevotellaceae bacterium]